MEVDEGSDQKSDIYPNWMTAQARLTNEFTKDEKYDMAHILFVHASVNFSPDVHFGSQVH